MAKYRCEKCAKEMEEINFYKYDVDQKFDSEKNQIVVKWKKRDL